MPKFMIVYVHVCCIFATVTDLVCRLCTAFVLISEKSGMCQIVILACPQLRKEDQHNFNGQF